MTSLIGMIRVDHIPNPKDSYCLTTNGPQNCLSKTQRTLERVQGAALSHPPEFEWFGSFPWSVLLFPSLPQITYVTLRKTLQGTF